MKKRIYFIMFFVMAIVVFNCKVYAETDLEKINIVSLIQNNSEIQKNNDIYIVDNYNDEIVLKYQIDNYNIDSSYNIEIYNSLDHGCGYDYNPRSVGFANFKLKNESETEIYTIKLYKEIRRDGSAYYDIIDTKTIQINLRDYEKLKNISDAKIYITNVIQNGRDITPTINDDAKFNILPIGLVTVSLKGVNFQDELVYKITNDVNFNKIYTGKEINDGIDIELIYLNELHNTSYFYVTLAALDYTVSPIYRDNDKDLNASLEYEYSYDYNFDYSILLKYGDGSNITNNIISKKKYESDRTLKLMIKGTNLEEKDYPVLIIFNDKNNIILNEKLTINGKLLNEGYIYQINNLDLDSDVFKATYDNNYYINVSINNEIRRLGFDYHLSGDIDVVGYYDNGVTVIPGAPKGPLPYQDVIVSSCYIENNSEIILKYNGTNYDDDKEYYYIFSDVDGHYIDISLNKPFSEKIIESGKIMGSELNNKGLIKKVLYDNSQKEFTYKLIIKDDDETVNFILIGIELYDMPFIELNFLKPYETNSYFKLANKYVFPIDMNKQLQIKGICGIDENTNYNFDIFESLKERESCYYSECKRKYSSDTLSLSGKQLKNGYIYRIKDNDDLDLKYHEIQINSYEINNYNIIPIQYMNIDDYFDVKDEYTFDKQKMIIQNIPENISINEFMNNILLHNNSIAKVYYDDKEINNTDIIKSGMMLKIGNADNLDLFEIKLKVNSSLKGDMNGNGKIDLQDIIILLKKYLGTLTTTEEDKIIGDMDNNGSIGLKDIILLLRSYLGTN